MNKIRLIVLLSTILMLSFTECRTQNMEKMIDKTTVKQLDIDKYLGTWYEIGRYEHSFEKNLVGCTATYTKMDNGMIEVLNQGYYKTLSGKHKTAKGKAKLTDQPGKLKVSFFLFFYADYNILELDQEGYQWAIIGSSGPGYLWILSRKPVVSDSFYRELLLKAESRGYDSSKVIKVLQK
ncbi:MAG: lipocalin family protein [Prolixibacteraceae bacterium]|jgi:apolipoprotein D and lipocalin family protein